MIHKPVLQKEVLEYLDPRPNENFVDCTIGEGGHALAIAERILPAGILLGIDLSFELIQQLKIKIQKSLTSEGITGSGVTGSQIKDNLILINDSYANLKKIVEKLNFRPVNGILIDLGMSSWHLEESGRGFTFLKEEPLDMRYATRGQISDVKPQNYLTAEKIVNEYPREAIEKILREYGEERFFKRIAKQIIEERKLKPIKTTLQLVEVIKKSLPFKYQSNRIHFATRTFQALRIAVNDELNNLKKILPQAEEILAKNGRLVVISFHSLEDRIVKNFFKELSTKNFKILTKKPKRPTKEEIKINPRARSAKLRAVRKN